MTVHWCGTGLSAIPGLRLLIEGGTDVVVWNRTVEKARAELGDLEADIRVFDTAAIGVALGPGDILVSMLPGDWHVPLAEMCIGGLGTFLRRNPMVLKWQGKVVGSIYCALGVRLAFQER